MKERQLRFRVGCESVGLGADFQADMIFQDRPGAAGVLRYGHRTCPPATDLGVS